MWYIPLIGGHYDGHVHKQPASLGYRELPPEEIRFAQPILRPAGSAGEGPVIEARDIRYTRWKIRVSPELGQGPHKWIFVESSTGLDGLSLGRVLYQWANLVWEPPKGDGPGAVRDTAPGFPPP